MFRLMLKILAPMMVGALLDRACRKRELRRAAVRQRLDVQTWEGEGGALPPLR
jgi:hypothetical protein